MSAISPLRFALAASSSEGSLLTERPIPRLLALALAVLAHFSCLVGAVAEEPQPTHLITGTVINEAGTPVANATVTAERATITQHTVTDADGRFRLEVPAIRADFIYASLNAETPTGLLGALVVQQAKPEPVRLVVKPGRELSVIVQDSDGQPVADAQVAFIAGFRPLARGATDAAGRWSGHVPSDVKDWTIVAYKSNVGLDYATSARSRGAIADPHPLPDHVTLMLDGARTFRIKAVDRHNHPVAGVQVGTWLVQKHGYEAQLNLVMSALKSPVTGDDGIAVIDWLPARVAQSWSIRCDAKDLFCLDRTLFIPADSQTEEITLKLLPIEKLSGRVTHVDGRPAIDMPVRAYGRGSGLEGFNTAARTDAEGRYTMRVHSQHAYVVTAADQTWAAPYRADIIIRPGQPVSGVDFVLARSTRVHGQVTASDSNQPSAKSYVNAFINKGPIPEELQRPSDIGRRTIGAQFGAQTGADGRYEIFLGAGEYTLQGPPNSGAPFKLTIPAVDPPSEIVHDFKAPQEKVEALTVRIIDQNGKPVPGALLQGQYAAPFQAVRRMFSNAKADEQGQFKTERTAQPLVLFARTVDDQLGGVITSSADATQAQIVVGPLATAAGRLIDEAGRPLATKELTYGVKIHQGEPGRSPWMTSFGGKVTTDTEGRFKLRHLVPGQRYDVSVKIDNLRSRNVVSALPTVPGELDLGNVNGEFSPIKPYVPPTPAEKAAKAFAGRAKSATRQRLDDVLAAAEREYTRPLVLLGGPENKACVELFRLFDERPEPGEKQLTEKTPTPNSLRWEFELLSLDDSQPEVRDLATQLGVKLGHEPVLAVLTGAGSLTATYPLRLAEGKLDPAPLSQFLAAHKLPTRDAQKMLAEGLRRAQTEDKRLFFIFSASWCGPCRMLAEFLSQHKAELDKHCVFVKLDVSRDDHASALRDEYKGAKTGGVPWFTILDSQGHVLTTSNDPTADPEAHFGNSNIGFPSNPKSIDHFITMLKTSCPRLPENHLTELRAALLKSE